MSRLIAPVAIAVSLLVSACGGGESAVAEFANVGDLVPRANVQQSDAVVGSVASIDLIERDDRWIAQVEMDLDPDVELTTTTRAVVRSTSLLGEKYVDIVPGEGGEPLGNAPIPIERTGKAPELEAVFSELGGILQSGALEDLAAITTASAMILEGQEENVGIVLDQTAKVIATISRQREAVASALDDLAEASGTLSSRTDTIDRALDVSDDALRIVSSQRAELSDLITQLDRLGKPLGELMRAHEDDIDAQVEAVNTIVPRLYEVRSTLEAAIAKLPDFTRLFARAVPGDYVQLDVYVEALPIGTPTSSAGFEELLMESTR